MTWVGLEQKRVTQGVFQVRSVSGLDPVSIQSVDKEKSSEIQCLNCWMFSLGGCTHLL
jgi:hypothetical protein